MTETPRLEARALSKTFGRARVLADAALTVMPGEIHALVGQNGSGKSTLVKVLTGYHAPDAGGSLRMDGVELALPVRWADAAAAGMSVVHQDLGLLDHMTIAENIGIGGYVHSRWTRRIDWKAQNAIATRLLDRLDVPLDAGTRVAGLSAMHRAEVAIARALRDHTAGQGLVILDEATRALPREELHRFHALLRRVVADGTSILMVSHNLEEVLTLADRVTVLRDGALAAAGLATAGLTEHDIARHMLGRAVESMQRAGEVKAGPVKATVRGLVAPGLPSVDLEVRAGEVVGLTGLPGSGFERVPRLITGADRATAGTLVTDRGVVDLADAEVSDCLAAGITLVPEKRIVEGLALDISLRDNMAVPSLTRRGHPWFVSQGWQQRQARDAMANLGIRARSERSLIKELSGGNQQKVLLAKWLSVRPDVLVLHEPTQAVDVGARVDILRTVRETAAEGVGVLLASIEPTDLVEACDRIVVIGRDGSVRELRTSEPEVLLEAIYAGSEPDGAPASTFAEDQR